MAAILYTSNTIFYVPPYVDSITVDCIGGGGAGGGAFSSDTNNLSAGGGGGAGGAFARGVVPVTSFTKVTVVVGAQQTNSGTTGNDSSVSYTNTNRVVAGGGLAGGDAFAVTFGESLGNGGGGWTIGSSGSSLRAGGNGANATTFLQVPEFYLRARGGGGGGSAGIDSVGGNALSQSAGTGGIPNGGAGGSGGSTSQVGAPGSIPGGGGGGGAVKFFEAADYVGGAGARGQVTIYYDDNVSNATFVDCTDFAFPIPDGVTEVLVECWGAGGSGGGASGAALQRGYGGGGAGGNYSRKEQAVTSGNILYITAPSTNAVKETQGGTAQVKLNSTFVSAFVIATGGAGGAGGPNGNIGAGGVSSVTGCVGDAIIGGGDGGTGARNPGVGFSGGGGGGGGSISGGGDATGQTAGTGGEENGGAGGEGRAATADGLAGSIYGGGGGGGMSGVGGGSNVDGGDGAKGLVRIWYKNRNTDFFNFFNLC
jgi:hypothetical protein